MLNEKFREFRNKIFKFYTISGFLEFQLSSPCYVDFFLVSMILLTQCN